MIDNAQISNQLSFLIIVLMYTSGMFYNVVMPLILPIVFKTNTHSNTSERLPIFPGYDVAFNAKISPVYEITYVFFICAMLDQNDFMNMIPYAMLFISLNFNILIMCYSSELLDSQFVEIGEETYKTEWYKFSVKIRTYFILIISISQRSQKITAGGIVELSYATYLSIIKTGFAYMQILRAADM
ncbi:odorant receptor 67c-like [Microplitis demolitor]|uniref:odorant receptor 67c-like n=1 Tax=Microplitis demolitor TaxID=69319 RepID=UPI00235B6E47|nr:odorant receptor 67c-like [Microplitis demolitor]